MRRAVLEHPDPRLRTVAQPVTTFDGELSQLVDDLLETMYAGRAIGLAATQVGVPLRVLVLDVSPSTDAPQVFINPEVLAQERYGMVEESCMSVPGVLDSVRRATRVRVRARDRAGQPLERQLVDMEAVCLLHELDHLDGRLFVDRLGWWRRLRWRRELGGRGRGRGEDARAAAQSG
ncbi:MAG: peptide deformylase [Steroidobacteraceae bacterium]